MSPRLVSAAETITVVLLRPADPNGSDESDSWRTVEAELRAEGFEVIATEADTGIEPGRALRRAAIEHRAFAAVIVTFSEHAAQAQLWASDRVAGNSEVRTIEIADLPAADLPRTIAIRTVEILRANLLRFKAESEPPPQPPPPAKQSVSPPTEPTPPAAAPSVAAPGPWSGFHFRVDGAVLTSFDEVGPAFGPRLGVGYGFDPSFAIQLSILGPTFAGDLLGRQGVASVRQEAAIVAASYTPYRGTLAPFLSLGGGAFHLQADGQLAAPFEGRSQQKWSAAVTISGGASLRLHENVAITTEAGLLFVAPRPVVRMLGERLGAVGRPSFVNTLGISARL